jgi:hypothetical protein
MPGLEPISLFAGCKNSRRGGNIAVAKVAISVNLLFALCPFIVIAFDDLLCLNGT